MGKDHVSQNQISTVFQLMCACMNLKQKGYIYTKGREGLPTTHARSILSRMQLPMRILYFVTIFLIFIN